MERECKKIVKFVLVMVSIVNNQIAFSAPDKFDDVLNKFELDLKKDSVVVEKKSDNVEKNPVQVVGKSPDEIELKTLSESLLSLERSAESVASEIAALSTDIEKEQKRTGLVTIVLDQSTMAEGTVINRFIARINGRKIFSFDPLLDSYDPNGMKFIEAPLSVGKYLLELEYSIKTGSSRDSKVQSSQSSMQIEVSQPTELIEYALSFQNKSDKVEARLRRL